MLPYKKLLLRRNAFFRQQLSMQLQDASPVADNIDPLHETGVKGHPATLHAHTDDASSSHAVTLLQQLSR
ncbi:hypothetical protein [Rheinheimera sp. F8]|uniref:hypothetical protein n=1 Tax=Rheinheimera sp. F8 TaxID=1763998 RepID=UPI000744D550|nr:hypothetical protein [Rheinheimera sp. F8]ALZ77356.1 hypothetical protein ATY27_17380 [Rheinheimera sp. F8]